MFTVLQYLTEYVLYVCITKYAYEILIFRILAHFNTYVHKIVVLKNRFYFMDKGVLWILNISNAQVTTQDQHNGIHNLKIVLFQSFKTLLWFTTSMYSLNFSQSPIPLYY